MTNSIEQNLKREAETTNTYFASGVYKITSLESGRVYIGHRDRNFSKMYTEHHRPFKNNNSSKFTQKLTDNIHMFVRMEDI